MKALIVVHGYPPAAIGGTELYAQTHAGTLRREYGDDVVVLARECDPSRDEYAIRTEHRDGIRLVLVNNTYRRIRRFEDVYASAELGQAIDVVVDEVHPDVAHIHHLTHLSTTIVDSLARRNIPTFMTLHDYWLICHRGQLLDANCQVCNGPEGGGCASCIGPAGSAGRLGFAAASLFRSGGRRFPIAAERLRHAAAHVAQVAYGRGGSHEQADRRVRHMQRLCRKVTHFFAPSRFIRDRFIRFGIAPDRITHSPYGVDHRLAAAAAVSARPPNVLRVAFIGSLMASKAPHLLIEAAAMLPAGSITVDLYGEPAPYHGDDSYDGTLRPLLSRPGVTVHGPIAHDRVADALGAADVVVVPSIWPENSPFAIHEAFLARVPVVASRIGGIPEIVAHGKNGLLFEAGDSGDLRRQLERLVRERGLLESLRHAIPTIRTIEDDVAVLRSAYRRRTQPIAKARLAAIVLNFETPDETLLAVKALRQSDRPFDALIVVNNGRNDSLERLRDALGSAASAITVVHTGENLGFSGGMNAGIREAIARGCDRFLLVNSDVIVPPDCAARLEEALAMEPAAGIVGPVMVARTDPGRLASLGISYSHATGRMRHHQFGAAVAETPLPRIQEVDAVSGCVMLITREALDAVGGLDEAYFFSFEDVDFCLRAKRAGFASIIAGAARVYHEGHRTIGHRTPARLYFAARNHLLLARRANGSAMPFGLWAAPIVAFNIAHAIRTTGGSLPARIRAVMRGTRDYARGRFGAGDESARLTR